MSILEQLDQSKIVAIMRGFTAEQADGAVAALADGGVRFVEVTMNTPGVLDMIARLRSKYGERVVVGAGTVLDIGMAKEAVAAGAQFLVSPNTDGQVIAYAAERQMGIFPGAMTPTEIVQAWQLGATAVKLFPSRALGLEYFREVRAPLDQIRMMPTGGVTAQNIAEYIAAGAFAFGIGGSLANKELVVAGRFAELRELASQYVQAATKGRASNEIE